MAESVTMSVPGESVMTSIAMDQRGCVTGAHVVRDLSVRRVDGVSVVEGGGWRVRDRCVTDCVTKVGGAVSVGKGSVVSVSVEGSCVSESVTVSVTNSVTKMKSTEMVTSVTESVTIGKRSCVTDCVRSSNQSLAQSGGQDGHESCDGQEHCDIRELSELD